MMAICHSSFPTIVWFVTQRTQHFYYRRTLLALFTEQKLDNFFKNKDNDHINSAINVENYKAGYNKTLNLYTNSIAKRVSVFGLGKKNNSNNDKIRSISANIIRKFDNRNISIITVDAKSFNLNNKNTAQAFMEGLVLGQYKFFVYKITFEASTLTSVKATLSGMTSVATFLTSLITSSTAI